MINRRNIFNGKGGIMEVFLKKIYDEYGINIFCKDFDFLKYVISYDDKNNAFLQDALLIHKIISGNKFYQIAAEQLKNSDYFNQNIYNVYLTTIYSQDVIWEDTIYIQRTEELFRLLLSLINIDVSNYNKMIPSNIYVKNSLADRKSMLNDIIELYKKGQYEEVFSLLKNGLQSGMNDCNGLLGICYFYGHGTKKNYNKALEHLVFPQNRIKAFKNAQFRLLNKLIDFKEKSKMQAVCNIVCNIIIIIMMYLYHTFTLNPIVTLIFILILIGGLFFSIYTIKKQKIYDFSLWNIMIMCMFYTILIL